MGVNALVVVAIGYDIKTMDVVCARMLWQDVVGKKVPEMNDLAQCAPLPRR